MGDALAAQLLVLTCMCLMRRRFIPRGEHSKQVLCRELLHLSECGQHPNIVQLKVCNHGTAVGARLCPLA